MTALIPDPWSLIPYIAAALVSYVGYRAGALTAGGAVAACAVGGTVFGFGGLAWAVLLVLFFAFSSALSFVKASDPRKKRAVETFEKGGRRDAAQVLANGGVAALMALLSRFVDPGMVPLLFGAYTGSLAAATADTWATEVGVLSSRQPRMITTGKAVAAGTSGGVTLLGTGAGLAGAAFLGASASALALLLPSLGNAVSLILAGLAGGLAGSVADSLLGASLQAGYLCPRCEKPTESRVHACGTPTTLVRGFGWVNNDLVNLLATVVGAGIGWATALLLDSL